LIRLPQEDGITDQSETNKPPVAFITPLAA